MFYPNSRVADNSENEDSEDEDTENYLSRKLVGQIFAAAKAARDDSDVEVVELQHPKF